MKFNIGDVVEHRSYGSGLVKHRYMSANGANELYDVLFTKGLCPDGMKCVLGSKLTLVFRPDMPGKGSKPL